MTDILCCGLDLRSVPADAVGALLDALPERRREKASAFRQPEDRLRSLGAGLLLRYSMEEFGLSDALCAYDQRGKPLIEGHPELFLSLSHSGDWAACALGRAPVTIDIEEWDGVREAVLRRAYTAREQEYCSVAQTQEERERRFYAVWCRKECMAKHRAYRYVREIDTFAPEEGFRFFAAEIPGYACAVYSCACPGEIRLLRWMPAGLVNTGIGALDALDD